jgi:hypothetical protein
MDSQVQELLQEERKVNTQVKQALQQKREKLATIQQHTERAVANERRELQEELNMKIAQVSKPTPFSILSLSCRVPSARIKPTLSSQLTDPLTLLLLSSCRNER